jgi:SAM-dependent methyltransferase
MSRKIKTLDSGSFAKLLGATKKEVTDTCGDILSSKDFRYTILDKEEKDNTLLTVIKAIDTPLSVSGKGRKEDWEKGWSENLEAFMKSNYDLSSLVPKYMHKSNTRRLFSEYIKPLSDDFEVNFYSAYRHFLFRKYLSGYQHIYEFGCGTGYNLVIMAQLFPDKDLTGLDWAASSVKLVNRLAEKFGYRMRGRSFDYFNPDDLLDIPDHAAFITLNSLEQTGGDHDKFIRFILKKRPALCVNSEPIAELYDQNNLLDCLAVKYHHKRNYLHNYLSTLRKYEDKGLIEILKTQRVQSGNLFHDGYSYVVWKVK